MDWFRFPPLNSLRAFSAVAEAGSFTHAASMLNVTHAAVRQQVKLLESRVGVALVSREGRGIAITDDGRRLARDLEEGFSLIERGINRLASDMEVKPVQVTMPPAFAVEWLMPRIADFQQTHPETTLLLNPTSELVDPKPGGTDVAIRYRDRRRRSSDIPTVLVTDMVVVGAPSLADGLPTDSPESLVDLPWLQELGTNEVADWFRHRGVIPDKPLNITQMPGNLIMNGVRRGDGITYSARAFFQDDIVSGRMIELFTEPLFGFYCIETLPGSPRPAVETFINWLLSNAEVISTT